MKILKITKEERNQLENHLIVLESKINRVETIIWYTEEELSDIPLRTQNMISIIEDYMKLLKKDIDKLYAMAGLNYSKNKKCSSTGQSKKLH